MQSERKKKYTKYIQSAEWAKIRADLITIYGGCQDCGSKSRLQVHHLTYKNLFFEEPEDLVLLCSRCHQKEHGLSSNRKKKGKRKKNSDGNFHYYKKKVLAKHNVRNPKSIRTWRQLAKVLYWHETLTFEAKFVKKGRASKYVKTIIGTKSRP